LDDALDRMNNDFLLTLAGRPEGADTRFGQDLEQFWGAVRREEGLITLEGEGDLAARLRDQGGRFEALGRSFFSQPARADRAKIYFGTDDAPGLRRLYCDLNDTARER